MSRRRLIDRRQELELSQEDVAALIGVNVRMVRSYEQGTATPRQRRRTRLAEVYGWSPAKLTLVLHDEDEPAPLNGHAVPGWLGRLADIEQAAGSMAAWEPFAVHGLLQTEAYALAVERADAVTKSDDAIVRRVRSRLARQQALNRTDSLRLSVILDESVLHRVAGDRATMGEQLDHLAAVRPNVDLRVLPLAAGRFSAAFGAFALFWQPGMPAPWMAVTEDRAGPHYHDADHQPHAVQAHVDVFDHLAAHTLDPDSTIDLIRRMAKEYR